MARILVIDDMAPVRATWRDILEDAGHEVFDAPDGEKGLTLATREPIDLVLTDLFMPDKDGIETIRELRRTRPEIRIIAISGNIARGGQSFLRMARNLGADYTLSKPIEQQQLVAAVDYVLQQKERTESVEADRSAGSNMPDIN
jgi:DNA-binding response OmpR family regulator